MKCPACFHELTQKPLGQLAVDVCDGGCGGIWFDAFELQKVEEAAEELGEALLHIRRDALVVLDRNRKRECPRCPGVKLHRHFFSGKRRTEIDQCPGCAGYWLDAGELAAILAERAETTLARQLNPAEVSSDVIRYIYRLKSEHRPAS